MSPGISQATLQLICNHLTLIAGQVSYKHRYNVRRDSSVAQWWLKCNWFASKASPFCSARQSSVSVLNVMEMTRLMCEKFCIVRVGSMLNRVILARCEERHMIRHRFESRSHMLLHVPPLLSLIFTLNQLPPSTFFSSLPQSTTAFTFASRSP